MEVQKVHTEKKKKKKSKKKKEKEKNKDENIGDESEEENENPPADLTTAQHSEQQEEKKIKKKKKKKSKKKKSKKNDDIEANNEDDSDAESIVTNDGPEPPSEKLKEPDDATSEALKVAGNKDELVIDFPRSSPFQVDNLMNITTTGVKFDEDLKQDNADNFSSFLLQICGNSSSSLNSICKRAASEDPSEASSFLHWNSSITGPRI